MNKINSIALASVFAFTANTGLAADDSVVIGNVAMPDVQSSAAFEQIKKKLGKWEGQLTQSLTGVVYDVSYEWKLVSGGSTIVETVFEDGVEHGEPAERLAEIIGHLAGGLAVFIEHGVAHQGVAEHVPGQGAQHVLGEIHQVVVVSVCLIKL